MIEYPDDGAILDQVREHDIPADVLIRDLVRLVEVLHLDAQGFFSEDSVLAGSMGLRCFRSPRFTVIDADFSTSQEAAPRIDELQKLLTYSDDDLEIDAAKLTPHDQGGTAWESEPITYEPAFTDLVQDGSKKNFKADFSMRGLVRRGIEKKLYIPYKLGIWTEAPTVFIMDPHETVAEKILGWCINGRVKHYADLAFIELSAASPGEGTIELDDAVLRETLGDKIDIMHDIQPTKYAGVTVESLRVALEREPTFDQKQWGQILYTKGARVLFDEKRVIETVRTRLAPRLKP